MKSYEIKEVLKNHRLWLAGNGGKRANLQDANLQRAYLQGVDLQDACLQGVDLQDACLQGANLQGVDLREANLRGAYLRGAYLRGAYLRGAYLRGADLRGAYLRGANLRGANLQGACLQGAIKIKSKKIASYNGSDYYCIFFGSIIKIGCEVHYLKDWEAFSDKEILKMDGEPALRFWKKEKKIIIAISKNLTGGK